MEALRTTILNEVDPMGSKRRFGLFSSPISTAIGDDGPFKSKLRNTSFIQTPKTSKENLRQQPEASIRTRPGVDNSINLILHRSAHQQPARSRISISILIASCCLFKTKTSKKATRKSKCSSLPQALKKLSLHLMTIHNKTLLKKIQKETDSQTER